MVRFFDEMRDAHTPHWVAIESYFLGDSQGYVVARVDSLGGFFSARVTVELLLEKIERIVTICWVHLDNGCVAPLVILRYLSCKTLK